MFMNIYENAWIHDYHLTGTELNNKEQEYLCDWHTQSKSGGVETWGHPYINSPEKQFDPTSVLVTLKDNVLVVDE